ncbi:MAG: aldehyde dehydrogenase family protein [Solirubrobacterales bacterium]
MAAARAQERRSRLREILSDGLPAGKLLIGGEWVESAAGGTRAAVEPATGAEVHRLAEGDAVDIDRAVAAARSPQSAGRWAATGPFERARVLRQISALIEANAEELALLESADVGKPLADAEGDVDYAAACFDYFASLAVQMEGSTRHLDSGIALVRRAPVGAVGIITPFNFPLGLSSVKVAAALAAGCTVIHKPSEKASLSALAFANLTLESDLPAGAYNVVTGGGEHAGAALVAHPDVAKIVFTGSTAIGRQVAASAAQTIKRVTMELGGKSANIVCADADVEASIGRSHFAYTMNAGQYCEAGSRLLASAGVYDELVEGLEREAAAAPGGDPFEPGSAIGPLITPEAADRVRDFVRRGVEAGAEVVGGGGEGGFVRPAVVVGAARDSELATSELFGPVVVVLRFDDLEEAIEVANSSDFGLAAGIQTGNLEQGLRVADRLEAGTIWINDWATGNLTIPVGGWKQSGIGREQGPEGLSEFLEYKSILASL